MAKQRSKPITINKGKAKTKRGRKTPKGQMPEATEVAVVNKLEEYTGNVELLHEKVRFALFCRTCNYSYKETAEEVAKRFQCEEPAPSTVHHWVSRYHDAADSDCVKFRNELRQQQDLIIAAQLRKWLPVASTDKFPVQRYGMGPDGEIGYYIDEKGFKEQAKAAEVVIKLLDRQAKLWNLDLADESKTNGIPPEQLGLLIIQQMREHPRGASMDVESQVERLELTAGDEHDIDKL